MAPLNRWFDSLPRTRVGLPGREVPAFRACGVTGYYLAVITVFTGGLLRGSSLLTLAVLCAVTAWSFFAWAHLRRWATGHEELVLMEHLWIAIGCAAGALKLLHEPVLVFLDLLAVALAVFLTAGRVGCLLVGCCHGLPSQFGIVYPHSHSRDGFAIDRVGIRLFPVQALEAGGLALIAVVGAAALPWARSGTILIWLLASYAVMRFGLEQLRGDQRPHWLGISQGRWMAMVQFAVALGLSHQLFGYGWRGPQARIALAILCVTAAAAAAAGRRGKALRVILQSAHVNELRNRVEQIIDSNIAGDGQHPADSGTTSCGVCYALSVVHHRERMGAHLSLSLPAGRHELSVLCELAAHAFPELATETCILQPDTVLHLFLAAPLPATLATSGWKTQARLVEFNVLRRLLSRVDVAPEVTPVSSPQPATADEPQPIAQPQLSDAAARSLAPPASGVTSGGDMDGTSLPEVPPLMVRDRTYFQPRTREHI